MPITTNKPVVENTRLDTPAKFLQISDRAAALDGLTVLTGILTFPVMVLGFFVFGLFFIVAIVDGWFAGFALAEVFAGALGIYGRSGCTRDKRLAPGSHGLRLRSAALLVGTILAGILAVVFLALACMYVVTDSSYVVVGIYLAMAGLGFGLWALTGLRKRSAFHRWAYARELDNGSLAVDSGLLALVLILVLILLAAANGPLSMATSRPHQQALPLDHRSNEQVLPKAAAPVPAAPRLVAPQAPPEIRALSSDDPPANPADLAH